MAFDMGSLDPSSFHHGTASVGSYALHYVFENTHTAKNRDLMTKTIVLVHGWPDLWFGWRKLIRPLTRLGFKYPSLCPLIRCTNERSFKYLCAFCF